jgi:hypothetical protein
MADDFAAVFSALKPVLAKYDKQLQVTVDTPNEYTVVTRSPSPFKQHKGEPLFFASVRVGKAYVSFHLMALYMCPTLNEDMSAALKKRMQGKACFNFKALPEADVSAELKRITAASIKLWGEKKWL